MKFVPLIIALLAAVAGWVRLTPLVIPALALLNTFVVAQWRMAQVRDTPQRVGKPNMVAEGVYLFVLQVLILGAAYILGYFLGNSL